MVLGDAHGLFLGAIALGAVHGIEPGHGWPIAASYALDRTNKWAYGLAASLIIGIGHLVSSIAVVLVFFWATAYFDLTQIDEPITLVGDVQIGGPVSVFAGVLLVALGIREYFHGHSHDHGGGLSDEESHGHGDDHDHGHGHGAHTYDHSHSLDHGANTHDHDHADHTHDHDNGSDANGSRSDAGRLARLRRRLSLGDGGGHSHGSMDGATDRGMFGLAWFAFLLGFAHEEEFEIIALCTGSTHCLELMLAYALTVIAGIVALTMVLIAGYEHFESRVRRYTPYLPVVSATVLCVMGLGFVLGLF